MSKHARLAASQSHRWIACPGSIHMIEQFQDIYPEEDSEYAAEGTFAHELLSEQLEEQYLGGKEARMLQKGSMGARSRPWTMCLNKWSLSLVLRSMLTST